MALVNCFSTLGCPQRSLRQAVQLALSNGIPMVEVRTVSGSNDLPVTLGTEFGQPADLTAFLANTDITIPVIGSSHRLIADSFDFDELQELALWADAAGARYLRVFDGDGETLDDKSLDIVEAHFQQWEAMRAAHGIEAQLLIETHGVLCANGALETFCDRFQHAAILWDTHHTWAARNGLRETHAIIGQRLAHLHVKDSVESQGKRHYVLPGKGAFPASELADLLSSGPPSSAVISLEWEKHWHPELPDLEQALECAKAWT